MMWLLTVALAQNDCLSSDALPVAGTTGYRNALTALRTNAVTYAATAFAEREVFPLRKEARDEEEDHLVMVYEFNNLFTATRTPMVSFREDCPVDRRFASHPVDLIGANLGLMFRYKRVGGYYAAGFTLGAPSSRDTFQRYAGALAGYPMASVGPLMVAPLLGNRMALTGNSAMAIDSLGGVVIDAEVAEVRVGWTATSGLHLSAADPLFGLYANTVLGDRLTEVTQFELGARRFDPGKKVSDTAGHTSLFGRGLPLTEPEEEEGERLSPERLLTGHLVQDSIGGIVDLAGAYALAPTPQLFEGRVGLHSRGYHDRTQGTGGAFRTDYLIQGGVVQLPDQWYYGVEGGRHPQVRAEFQGTFDTLQVHATAMINDPEVLALFPFAVGAFHYRLSVRGRL